MPIVKITGGWNATIQVITANIFFYASKHNKVVQVFKNKFLDNLDIR